MSKTYLPYEPDQQLLLPAALQEWLPDDHLAYFISDVVDQLDMSKVTARYERERRGGPPYHPRMMVKVLLYGYCVGVASSRRIAQRLHEDIAFRVLAANNTPDFRTISDFRKDNVDALSGLFVQVLALCQQAGLVKLGHVALDGTKVKANASKHKAMSYQRMKEKAAQLAAEVAELLRQAQAADDEEDRRYGEDKRGDELSEELAFRERRLEKIREAMAALEAEAQAAAEQAEAEGGNHPGVPDDKAQRNFTDTESRIIPAPGGKDFLQAYNCQAVVDSAHQVIVAARATNQTSDKQQAAAMMEETIDNVGAVPREVSADAGYYSAKAVDELYALGVDPFVAPEQTRHGRVVPPAPRGRIPSHLSPRDRMRRKLQTKRGRQRYALRMQTVEPVFGQIKQGRGFRQFLLRGLEKVNGEWSLICTGHNLLQFKKAFPKNFKAYADACKLNEVQPGRMFVFETGELANPRYIINFPTKRHWRGKSRMEDIESGLKALASEIRQRNIRSIAIPPLGSSLGGLNWPDVRPRITEALQDFEDVVVVVFEAGRGTLADGRPNRSTRVPKMTVGRATLVALMHRYLVGLLDPFVTLLEVHKLMYFMQVSGEPLRLRFQKAPYGPYAENLRHVMKAINNHLISGYKDDGDSPGKQLELVPGAVKDATAFLDGQPKTKQHLEHVAELIEGFESPFGSNCCPLSIGLQWNIRLLPRKK